MKSATKEADEILKELRNLRDHKGAEVKEHELIDKRNNLMINMRQNQLQHVQKKKYDTIHAGDEVKVLSYGQKAKCL